MQARASARARMFPSPAPSSAATPSSARVRRTVRLRRAPPEAPEEGAGRAGPGARAAPAASLGPGLRPRVPAEAAAPAGVEGVAAGGSLSVLGSQPSGSVPRVAALPAAPAVSGLSTRFLPRRRSAQVSVRFAGWGRALAAGWQRRGVGSGGSPGALKSYSSNRRRLEMPQSGGFPRATPATP